MNYLKMLGLAAIAAGALMALAGAGTASASELKCTNANNEEVMCPAETVIHAVNEGKIVFDPPFGAIECEESTFEGKATTGGATETVLIFISTHTLNKCNAIVTVVKLGTLEIHTDIMDAETGLTNKNGTVTSTGTVMTVEFIGTHCIFETRNTDIGTLTGSTWTGKTATVDLTGTIPRTGGRSGAFCGTEAQWTGNYDITTPDWLGII